MHLSRQGSRFQSYELLNIILKTKYKTSRTKVVELRTTKVRAHFTIRGTFLAPSFISFVKKQLEHFNVVSFMEEFDRGIRGIRGRWDL